jgi:thiol-disulfide isomerase/thioredoxin
MDGVVHKKKTHASGGCGGGKGLQFEAAGAMPQLQRLRLHLDAWETVMLKHDDFDFGIQHLACLVQVHADIDWTNTLTPTMVEAAEARIRERVSRNPRSPLLELRRRNHRYAARPAEELVLTVKRHHHQDWTRQMNPKKLVVVRFAAGWCRPSIKMSPVFDDLARMFRNLIFWKDDVDEMEDVASALGAEGLPTFSVHEGGGRR